jgi:hypothetical protein
LRSNLSSLLFPPLVSLLLPPPPPVVDDLDKDEMTEGLIMGECSLPLHQMRQKKDYHIWLPLEAPPANQSKTAPVVSKPNFGKLRLRLSWAHSDDLRIGDFASRDIWLLGLFVFIFFLLLLFPSHRVSLCLQSLT